MAKTTMDTINKVTIAAPKRRQISQSVLLFIVLLPPQYTLQSRVQPDLLAEHIPHEAAEGIAAVAFNALVDTVNVADEHRDTDATVFTDQGLHVAVHFGALGILCFATGQHQ